MLVLYIYFIGYTNQFNNGGSFSSRAVLSEKFKSQRSTGSEAMLIGQLLHEVFQHVLLRRKEVGPSLSEAKLSDVVIQEIRKVLMSIDTLDQL